MADMRVFRDAVTAWAAGGPGDPARELAVRLPVRAQAQAQERAHVTAGEWAQSVIWPRNRTRVPPALIAVRPCSVRWLSMTSRSPTVHRCWYVKRGPRR